MLVPTANVLAANGDDYAIEAEIAESETINLDSYMENMDASGTDITIYGSAPSVQRAKPLSPNAAGGYFWVSWGGGR